jgi:hypothetical protein
MTTPKPLVLPRSERLVLARCEDKLGYPLELGVTISHTVRAFQVYDVYHGIYHETRNDDADVFYTQDAQEALLVYNSIVQGER